MINPVTKSPAHWNITIDGSGNRFKPNKSRYNLDQQSQTCSVLNCGVQYASRLRTSGLCDNHQNHTVDLLLTLTDPSGAQVTVPTHLDIIDLLIRWTETRNYDLKPFFQQVSFSILGGIADATSLTGDITHRAGITVDSVDVVFDRLIEIANFYFPENHTSSYQTLESNNGTEFPAIVLVYTILGLLICEEANRGDRWFWRVVMGDERKTTMLGAAMPIAYYASRSFPWGVEIGKASSRLVPSPI